MLDGAGNFPRRRLKLREISPPLPVRPKPIPQISSACQGVATWPSIKPANGSGGPDEIAKLGNCCFPSPFLACIGISGILCPEGLLAVISVATFPAVLGFNG
uniref:Uncharacterized protein n=1 Tax=Sphaerodactylus townsendi TaxID=933632 RepID=A0ACB8FEX5_9SAUR